MVDKSGLRVLVLPLPHKNDPVCLVFCNSFCLSPLASRRHITSYQSPNERIGMKAVVFVFVCIGWDEYRWRRKGRNDSCA